MSISCPNLKSIFDEAVARPDGPRRAAYLDGACRGDAALRAEVEAMVRDHERLGRFLAAGRRHPYPPALTQAESECAARTAIIGNAAQGLHPIAGQGFNLGLRDAATLAEVLAEAGGDPGSREVLESYSRWRRADRQAIIAFTDGLVRLFASPFGPLRAARSLGLVLFDLSPVAKSALSRLSLGFAARLPRLARGLPLVPRAAP